MVHFGTLASWTSSNSLLAMLSCFRTPSYGVHMQEILESIRSHEEIGAPSRGMVISISLAACASIATNTRWTFSACTNNDLHYALIDILHVTVAYTSSTPPPQNSHTPSLQNSSLHHQTLAKDMVLVISGLSTCAQPQRQRVCK